MTDKPKRVGRPPLPEDQRRTARLSMRTYPDVEEKARKNGTEWVEKLIRRGKDRTEGK